MNQIAKDLNKTIKQESPQLFDMMSDIGKKLFFPKGILSQSAEAKEKANKINATIGIAKEEGGIMFLPSAMSSINTFKPEETITYAPSFGIYDLRKQWQKSLYDKNPSLVNKKISLPIVTCGITHALSIFSDMWVNPNDTIIIPDMTWGNYNMIFNVRKGAKIVNYSVFNENMHYNVEAFKAVIEHESKNNKKIIVLLNFPQNPSGYTASEKESNAMIDTLVQTAQKGIKVICAIDDAYFGLFYDDTAIKESIFAKIADSHENLLAVKLDGATKENYVWGLRVGFITYGNKITKKEAEVVYEALEKKTAGCVRGNISNASHLSQTITLKSMQDPKYLDEKQKKFDILKARAKQVKKVLLDPKFSDAWDAYPFNSGYFMCLRLKTVNAEELRLHLLEKYGVGLISLDAKNIRIAFSCIELDEVSTLFDIILNGIRDLEEK